VAYPAFVAALALVAEEAKVALVAEEAKVALVAEEAAPLKVAVIVPALKLPEASRATTLLAVLVVVASTANVRAVDPLKVPPLVMYVPAVKAAAVAFAVVAVVASVAVVANVARVASVAVVASVALVADEAKVALVAEAAEPVVFWLKVGQVNVPVLKLPDVGVPREGVVKLGEVAKATTVPEPVVLYEVPHAVPVEFGMPEPG